MATGLITEAHKLLSRGDVSEAIFISNGLEEALKAPSLTKQELGMLSVLYLKLLDRLFGEEATSPPDPSAQTAASSSVGQWVKGSLGGWIRALSQQASTFGNIDNLPHPGTKLLKHFLPNQPLFGYLGEISTEFAVPLLPPKLQMLMTNHYLYHVVASPSHGRILQLLHRPASISRDSTVAPIQLDATEYFLFCLARYPVLAHHLSPHANFTTTARSASSAGGHFFQGPPSVVLRARGIFAWTGSLPYLALLLAYLQDFFPHARSGATGAATNAAMHIPSARHKEMFVRLAVEYWANVANVVHRDFERVPALRRQLYTTSPLLLTGQYGDSDAPRGHAPPHEALLLNGNASATFTLAACQGLYLLLFCVLTDPALRQQLATGAAATDPTSSAELLLHVMQGPLFDMIRCVFQKGEESAVDRELVRLTAQLWLLLLQPWAVSAATGTVDRRVAYSDSWRGYVAHSLHLYTTLCTSFLRMFAKINDLEDPLTLGMLDDVLTVLGNADLQRDVKDLQRAHLQALRDDPQWRGPTETPSRSPAPPSAAADGDVLALTEHHRRLFPDRSADALPQGGLCLPQASALDQCASISSSLQRLQAGGSGREGAGLLDVWLQATFSRVDALMGARAPDVSPLAHSAAHCLKQLHDWSPALATYILRQEASAQELYTYAAAAPAEGLRDALTSRLTTKGAAALRAGRMRCHARDVAVRCDPLDRPVCSFEHPAALRLCVALSKALNARLGLPRKPDTVTMTWPEALAGGAGLVGGVALLRDCARLNLRDLAQYRAVGALSLLLALLVAWRSWALAVVLAAYGARLLFEGAFPTVRRDL